MVQRTVVWARAKGRPEGLLVAPLSGPHDPAWIARFNALAARTADRQDGWGAVRAHTTGTRDHVFATRGPGPDDGWDAFRDRADRLVAEANAAAAQPAGDP